MNEVRILPPPYVIFTHLRRNLSSLVAPADRIKFAHCFPYKKPVTFNRIFCTLYYLPQVPACHIHIISLIANSIWQLAAEKKKCHRHKVLYSKDKHLMRDCKSSESELTSDHHIEDISISSPARKVPLDISRIPIDPYWGQPGCTGDIQ